MNYLFLYLLTILDSILLFISFVFVFTLTFEILKFFLYVMGEQDNKMYLVLKSKTILTRILLAISILIITFVPSKNDTITILVEGKTLNYVQQDSTLQKIPEQSTKLVYEFINKQIKELERK